MERLLEIVSPSMERLLEVVNPSIVRLLEVISPSMYSEAPGNRQPLNEEVPESLPQGNLSQ